MAGTADQFERRATFVPGPGDLFFGMSANELFDSATTLEALAKSGKLVNPDAAAQRVEELLYMAMVAEKTQPNV